MLQKCIEILVGSSAVLTTERRDFLRIGPINRSDFDARNGACCARMRVSNIAAANETYVGCHSTLIFALLNYLYADVVALVGKLH